MSDDELIRPLWSRVGEAGMTLASFKIEQAALRFDVDMDAMLAVGKLPPLDVAKSVREQVIREAIGDAAAYHVGGVRCEHLGEAGLQPRVVFAASTTLCEVCTVELLAGEGLEISTDACVFCGEVGPTFECKAQLSDEENAPLYVAHGCPACLRWFPTAHADVTSFSASVGGRPVE